MKRGFFFSTEAVVALAVVLLLLSGIVLFIQNPNTKPDSKDWPQTKIILNTQTRFITNSANSNYQGPDDYFCYRLHWENTGSGQTLQTSQNCEAVP